MKKNTTPKIICPRCGRQYLPGEIYVPNAFVGQPKFVERDVYGKILDSYNGNMCLKETYTCDKCDTTFTIKATVKFDTEVAEELNKTPYRMKLNKKLTLSEN